MARTLQEEYYNVVRGCGQCVDGCVEWWCGEWCVEWCVDWCGDSVVQLVGIGVVIVWCSWRGLVCGLVCGLLWCGAVGGDWGGEWCATGAERVHSHQS